MCGEVEGASWTKNWSAIAVLNLATFGLKDARNGAETVIILTTSTSAAATMSTSRERTALMVGSSSSRDRSEQSRSYGATAVDDDASSIESARSIGQFTLSSSSQLQL